MEKEIAKREIVKILVSQYNEIFTRKDLLNIELGGRKFSVANVKNLGGTSVYMEIEGSSSVGIEYSERAIIRQIEKFVTSAIDDVFKNANPIIRREPYRELLYEVASNFRRMNETSWCHDGGLMSPGKLLDIPMLYVAVFSDADYKFCLMKKAYFSALQLAAERCVPYGDIDTVMNYNFTIKEHWGTLMKYFYSYYYTLNKDDFNQFFMHLEGLIAVQAGMTVVQVIAGIFDDLSHQTSPIPC